MYQYNKCGRRNLEMLALADYPIIGVEPSYHKFPCLKSLSLSDTDISALDLKLLISACPKLEKLALVRLPTRRQQWSLTVLHQRISLLKKSV